eukprot:196425_1
MGREIKSVEEVKEFFLKLPVFFVATAPRECDGLLNISPKGFDGTLAFVDPGVAAKVTNGMFPGPKSIGVISYCDIGGSGIETIAHLRTTPRITIMGTELLDPLNPRIVRMFGNGYAVEREQPGYDEMVDFFSQCKDISGNYEKGWQLPYKSDKCRNFIIIDVQRVRDSCGFGVPIFKFVAHRKDFDKYKDWPPERFDKLLMAWNKTSLDGLPGLLYLQQKKRSKNWITSFQMGLFHRWWREKWKPIVYSSALAIIAFTLGYTQRSI